MRKMFFAAPLLAAALLLSACGEDGADSGSSMAPSGGQQDMELRIGTGVVTDLGESAPAAGGKNAAVKATVTVCSAVFDKDGKIVRVRFDEVQPAVEVKPDGTFAVALPGEVPTKREQGDDYAMKEASDIGKEWYQQMNGLEQWLVGKKATEVAGMQLENGYPTDGELKTTVTVKVSAHQRALQKAYEDAMKGNKDVGSASSSSSSADSVGSTAESVGNSTQGGTSTDISRVESNIEEMGGSSSGGMA